MVGGHSESRAIELPMFKKIRGYEIGYSVDEGGYGKTAKDIYQTC